MPTAAGPSADTCSQSELELAIASAIAVLPARAYQQADLDERLNESGVPLTPQAEPASLGHLAFTVDVVDGRSTGKRSQRRTMELISEVSISVCYRVGSGEDGLRDKRASLDLCAEIADAAHSLDLAGVTLIRPVTVGRLLLLSEEGWIVRVCTVEVQHDISLSPPASDL